MDLEIVIQREVNQKDKYHILPLIHELYKKISIDESISKAETETQS